MTLVLRNRQRTCALNLPLLRRILKWILQSPPPFSLSPLGGEGRGGEAPATGSLAIHFVTANQIAGLNEHFLAHSGPTDVITFNYGQEGAEIFICPEVAIGQSRQFRTTWQSELVRYIIHGILHLRGFDDLTPSDRRIMKREENRLLRSVGKEFSVNAIGSLRAGVKACSHPRNPR